jgi:hypothetical protein
MMGDVSDGKTKAHERGGRDEMVLTPPPSSESSTAKLQDSKRNHVTLYSSAPHLT